MPGPLINADLSTIAEYNSTLQKVPGKMNHIADALSRNTVAAIHMGLDYYALADAKRKDPEYQACRKSCTSLRWENLSLNDSNTTLLSDSSFVYIYVDVVGPLPTSPIHSYLFAIIDCSTYWPEAIPMETVTSLLYICLALRMDTDNRMVERFHCTRKVPLMSHCKDSNWFTKLLGVLLGLRTTPKDALDVLTAELVYGDPLVVPSKFYSSATSSDNL
ncbi:uncharacterized protein [Palaemon carinicauda]|uniref:uncharacterized protein n=1 Tax=Palaemon carinicauda TaxID=392227 RepID=UPI0035B69F01